MGKLVFNQALRTVASIKFVVKFGEGNTPQGCLLYFEEKAHANNEYDEIEIRNYRIIHNNKM